MKRKWFQSMAMVTLVVMAPAALRAGGVTYRTENGEYVKLGGRIQVQYHRVDPDDGQSTDEVLFRRLRPYIEGSLHEDWTGKFQWDIGKSDIAVKDAYLRYTGCSWADFTLGNHGFPFSQEFLTSSKYQQLVERTFVGDHNYGTPDRQAGFSASGACADKVLTWQAAVAMGAIDPDTSRLDFDSVVQIDKGDDWNEGPMAGTRLAWHPLGYLKPSQGDFDRDARVSFHVGAFAWRNDDDNLDAARSNDVDEVVGMEAGAALRGHGCSLDLQYNRFASDLIQDMVTSGLYRNGETDLENYAIEGGCMVIPGRIELVGGYQVQDADGYGDEWTRTSAGLNYFIREHDIKCQLTYRIGENLDGIKGNDADELFVQAQYVF